MIHNERPTVSIIVRTQNRPLLLKRAINSLLMQTFHDWCCVIVNDGGPRNVNESVAETSDRFLWIHNPKALGRTRAANQGIHRTKTPFIAFLDDDDTWEPEFLEKTVSFMKKQRLNEHYGAVAVSVQEIYEIIQGDDIIIQKKRPFRLQRHEVKMWELAMFNFLPTSSVLIDRVALDKVGLLDESLEYLEDWDLYLRLSREYEIGMLKDRLYNYHFRQGTQNQYCNTVSEKRHQCFLTETYLRNKYLREDIKSGKFGLGMMMNLT